MENASFWVFLYLYSKSAARSEAEQHWRTFLESLLARGLSGVQLIVSDDHAGLKAARKTFLTGILWQRCLFHLQQNVQSYVPRKSMQKQVAEDIRMIFNAPSREKAEMYLAEIVEKYAHIAPKLADWRRSISLKVSLSLLSQLLSGNPPVRTGSEYEPPIAWNGSARKSNAELELHACFRMRVLVCD
ncbi:MAG: transposase [Anaerolineales bacterium]|nr:transposase [Anaerolineales bacterium]